MPRPAASWLELGCAAAARLRAASEPVGLRCKVGRCHWDRACHGQESGDRLRNPGSLMSRCSRTLRGAALVRPGRAAVALLGALGGLAPCSPVLAGPFGPAVRAAAPALLSLPPRRVPGLSRLQRPAVCLCLAAELSSGPLDAAGRVVCMAGR